MKRAYIGIREAPVYRRDAFVAGLRSVGLEVKLGRPEIFDAETVFVCWNRYAENHDLCARLERAGGTVLIAENGYVAPGGASPHGLSPRTWFAIARRYHNDDTVVEDRGPERWNALDIEPKAFRSETRGHVLVCPNRSFGTPGRYMPPQWVSDVTGRLEKAEKVTKRRREIRVRPHPGNNDPQTPLSQDLAGAEAMVIWTSSAGVHSLIAGVPVVCEAPAWICKSAALTSIEDVYPQVNLHSLRAAALRRLAWAQWNLEEVESGEAFDHLLLRRAD